jgi:hypothetical protein
MELFLKVINCGILCIVLVCVWEFYRYLCVCGRVAVIIHYGQGFRFRVQGLEFSVYGLGFRISVTDKGQGFTVQGLGLVFSVYG